MNTIAITFVLSCNVVSSALLRNENEPMEDAYKEMQRNMVEKSGAGVYMTNIPHSHSPDSSIVDFVGRLDLLDLESVNDGNETRLTFLVHNSEEFDSLSESSSSVIVENEEETARLNSYANKPHVRGQKADTISGYPCFRNLDGMFNLMDELVTRASAIDLLDVTVTDIGDTYEKTIDSNEGYDIKALKITGNGVADKGWSTVKGIVFITCGVHAREYAPPELCARWAERLVENYGLDTETTTVLDHTEIHMIIESNPDGRYVAENDRPKFHRKNTNPGCSNPDNRGVDLNRNFPFKWGVSGGSSENQCDQTYRGTGATSEPEVAAIVAYAESIFPEDQRKTDPIAQIDDPYPEETTVGVAFDIHAYGNLIIWPYGYQERLSGNEEGLQAAARKIKGFNDYTLAGPLTPAFLYPASGVTDDYFYGELGALAFTYELGTEFYQDCDTFEDTIVPDNIPSLVYLAKISTKPYILAKGPDVTNMSISSTINYHPTTLLPISITVSDDELSAGPGNYVTSTQDIASISISVDMHPYDVDSNGNGPQIYTLPFEASPTSAPTQCTGSDFTVELTTDNFASETNWKVKNSAGDVVMENEYSLGNMQSYDSEQCLNEGDYTFEITDTFGDGICCEYGIGSYTLKIDGVLLTSGGSFGSSETVDFSVGSSFGIPDVSRNSGPSTWTKALNVPLGLFSNILRGPLIGEHMIYSQGTDSEGYIGPVKALSFTITCIDETSFVVGGVERDCAFVESRGACSIVGAQILCPSTCGVC